MADNPYLGLFEPVNPEELPAGSPGAETATPGTVTYGVPGAEPAASASGDNPYLDMFDKVDPAEVPEPNSLWASMGDALVEGATYGLDKHLYAQFGHSREDSKKQREANLRRHYWPVQGSYVLGGLASSIFPPSWIGRVPVAGRALNAVLPNVNVARSVQQGVTSGRLVAEGAKGAAKAAALYGVGDTDAENLKHGPLQRGAEIAGQSALAAAVGGPLNLLGARAGRWLGENVGEPISRAISTARRTGRTPTIAGRTEVLQAMRRDGVENIEDLIETTLPGVTYRPGVRSGPNATMPIGPRMAAVEAHSQAIADGMGQRAAVAQARQAYMQTAQSEGIQLTDGQVASQVRDLIRNHGTQNAIPINPSEATAIATKSPGKNTFLAYQQGVNSPGQVGNEAATFARDRQMFMGGRLEDLLSDAPPREYVGQLSRQLQDARDPYATLWRHLDENPTDEAVLGMRGRLRDAIEDTRRDVEMTMRQRNDDSSEAQEALREFQRRFFRDVQEADGQPPLRLDAEGRPYYTMDPYGNPVRDTQGNYVVPTSLEGYENAVTRSAPRDSLQAFKTERAYLDGRIQDAFRNGDTGLGQRLRDIRNALDNRVRQAARPDDGQPMTPDQEILENYWAMNDNFAATMRSDEAYTAGAKFPLSTGSGSRKIDAERALAQYEGAAPTGNMNETERLWFRRGVMAQVEALLSKMPGTHNPGKKFGDRQMRDRIERIFGRETLDELDRQVERINLATRTFGADKNSNTAANLAQREEQRALSDLAQSVLNPMELPKATYNYFYQERQRELQNAMMRYLGAVNSGDPHLYYPAMRELMEAQRVYNQFHGSLPMQRLYEGSAAAGPFTAASGSQEDFR